MPYLPQLALVALAAYDFATTIYVIKRIGAAAEDNPFWRFGFRSSPLIFDAIYILGVAALAVASTQLGKPWLIMGLLAAFTVVAINNSIALTRIVGRDRS